MTVKTQTSFDLETLKRGYEEWDIEALLSLYADDVEQIEDAVVGPDRAAATVICEFPGGRKVVANTTLELRGGQVVREHTVASGDS
jgi:hypothetical protein